MKQIRAHLLFAYVALFVAALFAAQIASAQTDPDAAMTQVPVVFSGGHETEGRDRGRPVILVASALGVPPEVFRDAFSHVRPAQAGAEPDPRQVRDNKTALMTALRRYGVTNERLDTVSNRYRYVRSRNELWPTKPATAYALVKNGVIVRYVVTDGGYGYSSPPTITVPALPATTGQAQLAFSKDFEKNGAISAITTTPVKAAAKP